MVESWPFSLSRISILICDLVSLAIAHLVLEVDVQLLENNLFLWM